MPPVIKTKYIIRLFPNRNIPVGLIQEVISTFPAPWGWADCGTKEMYSGLIYKDLDAILWDASAERYAYGGAPYSRLFKLPDLNDQKYEEPHPHKTIWQRFLRYLKSWYSVRRQSARSYEPYY